MNVKKAMSKNEICSQKDTGRALGGLTWWTGRAVAIIVFSWRNKQVIYIGDLFHFYYILDVQYLDWVVKQEQTVQKGLPQKTVTKL